MAKVKPKSVYTCNECGASSPKWVGQCPSCGAWNTLYETTVAPVTSARAGRQYGAPAEVHNLAEVSPEKIYRHPTGISELARVLGGGLVSGSVVLIGGDPGIGKSTLLTQAMATIGQSAKVLYVSGEESSDQIALRAQRLGLKGDRLRLLTETQVETILASARQRRTGARIRGAVGALRQADRHGPVSRGPRDHGRHVRRPTRAGTHGGYGA